MLNLYSIHNTSNSFIHASKNKRKKLHLQQKRKRYISNKRYKYEKESLDLFRNN